MTPTRRQLLGGLAALATVALLPRRASAFGDSTLVDVAELDLGPGTISRPNAWKQLLYDLTQSTSVECRPGSVVVKPDSAELFEHPFAVLLGDGAFEVPSEAAIEQLAQYLAYGGFLFVDDATGSDASGFDASVRRLCTRLFPTRPLTALPGDHPVMRSFFLLDTARGRLAGHPRLEGVTVGNQVPLVYSRNDVAGALDRDDAGGWRSSCVPGGESQRREARKVGINLMMYALTSDYKKDQAHVRQLMEEGRLAR